MVKWFQWLLLNENRFVVGIASGETIGMRLSLDFDIVVVVSNWTGDHVNVCGSIFFFEFRFVFDLVSAKQWSLKKKWACSYLMVSRHCCRLRPTAFADTGQLVWSHRLQINLYASFGRHCHSARVHHWRRNKNGRDKLETKYLTGKLWCFNIDVCVPAKRRLNFFFNYEQKILIKQQKHWTLSLSRCFICLFS